MGTAPIVSGEDIKVFGKGKQGPSQVRDVGGQISSQAIRGDGHVSSWAKVWDGPASLWAMDGGGPMSSQHVMIIIGVLSYKAQWKYRHRWIVLASTQTNERYGRSDINSSTTQKTYQWPTVQ